MIRAWLCFRHWLLPGAVWWAVWSALCLAGCSPELNWREVRPQGTALLVLLPCKPSHLSKPLSLAQAQVVFGMEVCDAGGVTWALAHAQINDPGRIGTALVQLREAAKANVEAVQMTSVPVNVPGMTPSGDAVRLAMQGSRVDRAGRSPVRQEVVLFAHGTIVFQATALGERLDEVALDAFFSSLRLDSAHPAPAPVRPAAALDATGGGERRSER